MFYASYMTLHNDELLSLNHYTYMTLYTIEPVTLYSCLGSSVGRALAWDARSRGFDPT